MSPPGERVALVTGGARRIGAAVSRGLARAGFTVALTYRASRREALALERQAAAWSKILAPRVRVGIVRPGLALIPERFPKAEWDRLRARGGARGPDSPGKIAAAVLRFARSGRYNFY